jgi:hypothetical protein
MAEVAGADGELIDLVPAEALEAFGVLFAYGSNLGATGGPARPTPPAWIRAQTKPVWMVYFPGADAGLALQEARSYPAVVGVVMDLESDGEGIPAVQAIAAAFGDDMTAAAQPASCYAHQATTELLAAHFPGQWFAGAAEDTPLGPRQGAQWGQGSAGGVTYDRSTLDAWFAAPGPSQPPSPAPAPAPLEEETTVVISCTRPDGGTDHFGLGAGGQMWHVATSSSGAFESRDNPPGLWTALYSCAYAGAAVTVQGIGEDGAAWSTSWAPGDAGWEGPVRLG